MRRKHGWTAALVAVVALGIAIPATAQKQPIPSTADMPLALPPLLEKLDWDPAERGPLLIVAPEKATPATKPIPNRPPGDYYEYRQPLQMSDLPSPNGPGYHIFTLEKVFDRKLMKAGSVSVFAPRLMHVLNWNHLPPPDPYAGLSRAAKRRLLEATLTDAQWQKLGSADGLGVPDLKPEQARLFLGMLPDPISIQQNQRRPDGSYVYVPPVALTDAQRASIRITVRRKLGWGFMMANGGQMQMGDWDGSGAQVISRPRPRDPAIERPGMVYGVAVREVLPNVAKPGDLNFASRALEPAVSLTGLKTVGELVARCASATGLKLVADPRYAVLGLYLRGEGARTGDVLQALTLGLTGTFRKVGDLWILTDDKVPLGVRMARIGEWASQNERLANDRERNASKARGQKRLDAASWGDGPKPDAALENKILDNLKRQREPWTEEDARDPSRRQLQIQIGQLPETFQAAVRKQLDQIKGFPPEHQPRADLVIPRLQITTLMLVPGIGEVRTDNMGGGDGEIFDGRDSVIPKLPPAPEAKPIPHQVPTSVMLAAATPDEATLRVTLAKERGFDAVWLEPVGDEAAILKAAIAAAKKSGIALSAVVRLARATSPDDPRDPTILGETTTQWARRQLTALPKDIDPTDWTRRGPRDQARQIERLGDFVRIDLPESRRRLIARLKAIAALPGLAGIVVRDPVPTGYLRFQFYDSLPEWATGFTDELRLETIRRGGGDPADLPMRPNGMNFYIEWDPEEYDGRQPGDLTLPFFPERGRQVYTDQGKPMVADTWKVWEGLRGEIATRLLKEIHDAGLGVPLLFEGAAWFGNFDKALEPKLIDPSRNGGGWTSDDYSRSMRASAESTSTLLVGLRPFYAWDYANEPIEIQVRRWIQPAPPSRSATKDAALVYDLTTAPDSASQERILKVLTVGPWDPPG